MVVLQKFWIVRFKFSNSPNPAFHVFDRLKKAKDWRTENYPGLEDDFQIEAVLIKRIIGRKIN